MFFVDQSVAFDPNNLPVAADRRGAALCHFGVQKLMLTCGPWKVGKCTRAGSRGASHVKKKESVFPESLVLYAGLPVCPWGVVCPYARGVGCARGCLSNP